VSAAAPCDFAGGVVLGPNKRGHSNSYLKSAKAGESPGKLSQLGNNGSPPLSTISLSCFTGDEVNG